MASRGGVIPPFHPSRATGGTGSPNPRATGGETPPLRVLFLCVHNSARSQLAEGLLRARAGDRVAVFSAGSEPSSVHPLAARVLHERGIDAAAHRSKSVNEFGAERFDYVITLCAEEVCPIFLGATHKLHWALPDPAAVAGDAETRLNAFRQTADELRERIEQFLTHPCEG